MSKLREICLNCQRCREHCFAERGCRFREIDEPCLTCTKAVFYFDGGPAKMAKNNFSNYAAFSAPDSANLPYKPFSTSNWTKDLNRPQEMSQRGPYDE